MKKLLTIALAMVMVLVSSIPVMAETTSVTISSGGGQIPIVKCKFETDDGSAKEDGDLTHVMYPGGPTPDAAYSQFTPPMVKDATKTITYYAVVTDAEDMGAVSSVFALVFHPVNSPAPYGTFNGTVPDPGAPDLANLFKYKVEFTNLGHGTSAINTVIDANNKHLIKFAGNYTINEVAGLATSEMNKGTADLWRGTAEIDYEQPGGYYTVRDYAIDTNNNYSAVLENQFLYIETAGVEVDFDSFNYGPINLKSHTVRAGDLTWDLPGTGTAGYGSYGATVRNIGNVWAHVQISQNDMAFGNHAGSNTVTAYSGTTAPTAAQSNWNVYYDLRLGNTGDEWFYDPNVTIQTPEFLGLSTLEELDFSINVYQGSGNHTGTMTIGAVKEPFTTTTPSPVGIPD